MNDCLVAEKEMLPKCQCLNAIQLTSSKAKLLQKCNHCHNTHQALWEHRHEQCLQGQEWMAPRWLDSQITLSAGKLPKLSWNILTLIHPAMSIATVICRGLNGALTQKVAVKPYNHSAQGGYVHNTKGVYRLNQKNLYLKKLKKNCQQNSKY